MDKENDIKQFFGQCDILSCPKHCEAKILANKYYNRLDNVIQRMVECALNITEENCEESVRKLNGLDEKFKKMNVEFMGILRSTSKCCIPQWMYDEYRRNYEHNV